MRSITETITIDAAPDNVHAFVSDLLRLPTWAIGFAKGIRQDGERWLVTLGSGDEVEIRADSDRAARTVDFVIVPAPGVEAAAPTRVLANGTGAEYLFTLFQAPDTPDEAFEQQAAELRRELTVLKAHVESSCPL